MIVDPSLAEASPLRRALRDNIRRDETQVVRWLADEAHLPAATLARIDARARALVLQVRAARVGTGGIDAFLNEFGLSTKEGVVLMCLAEALLRVPDAETRDLLIKDKIATADWQAHLGHSESLFVNASTWALMLTGRVVRLDEGVKGDLTGALRRLVQGSGEPVIRAATVQAMRILGRQFVMGRSIAEALERAKPEEKKGYRYSYDMLGEAAHTMADAKRYFEAYRGAIAALGKAAAGRGPIAAPEISIKLSALHPRYEFAQARRVLDELAPRLKALALDAKAAGIGLTVDAEESDRLDLSLDVIERVSGDGALKGWNGFGLAVQAYLKRAPLAIDWLADMARRHERRLMVRLVKGAYWDTEVKLAQVNGLNGYPSFTRKVSTDVCYLACAKRLLAAPEAFYPQFATHNAHTLAAVLEIAGDNGDFEFQRLHGMGEALYAQIVGPETPVRVYAPVGSHEDLLAYLVRRLLENGANTSFVNRIVDEGLPVEDIVADPIAQARGLDPVPHPSIPLPRDLYGAERPNSAGIDLNDPQTLAPLGLEMAKLATAGWKAAPIVGGAAQAGPVREARDPTDRRRILGSVVEAGKDQLEQALSQAVRAAPDWDATPAHDRAACLERAADLMEAQTAGLMALCVREAGKTLPDAIAEVREAPLVKACAERGTDYVDLCGEPAWMRKMIDAHDAAAKKSGARIVFSCGFDSIPFDLGVFYLQETAKEKLGGAIARVKGRVRAMEGKFSGGTAASFGATMAAAAQDPSIIQLLQTPFALTPGFEGPEQPAGMTPMEDESLGMWVAPFIMASINTKNVHRTNHLLGHAYGANFVYDEMVITGPGEQGEQAATALASANPMGDGDVPQPGEGPTKEEREAGNYDILFLGESMDGKTIKVGVKGTEDPGYASTSKMIAESAVCLTQEAADAPGGIVTPGAVLGMALIERLRTNAGISFEVED